MARRLLLALGSRARELGADGVEAPELVHHPHRVRPVVRAEVDDATVGEERGPLLRRVQWVVLPAVDEEEDFFSVPDIEEGCYE